jgi:ribosomal protein S16
MVSSLQQVQVQVVAPSPYLTTSHQHGRQTPPRTPRPQKHPLLPPGKSLPALVVPPLTVPQVAINSSKRRDALPLEKLGEYDPIPRPAPTSTSLAHAIEKSFHLASRAPTTDELREKREKRIVWDVERVRYWLGVGAQPSESVVKLLERVSRRFFWMWLERVESEDGRSVRLKPRMSATRGASQHGLRVERHDTGASASEDVQLQGDTMDGQRVRKITSGNAGGGIPTSIGIEEQETSTRWERMVLRRKESFEWTGLASRGTVVERCIRMDGRDGPRDGLRRGSTNDGRPVNLHHGGRDRDERPLGNRDSKRTANAARTNNPLQTT